MEIISGAQMRVLRFVAACNSQGFHPTAEEVEVWEHNPAPRDAVYKEVPVDIPASIRDLGRIPNLPKLQHFFGDSAYQRMLASTLPAAEAMRVQAFGRAAADPTRRTFTRRELVTPAETRIEHLIRIMWLETVPRSSGEPGLRLTDLARALVRDSDSQHREDSDVSVVVLEAHDPLAYPTLIGHLAAAGTGLIVDPYLKVEDLHRLVVSTQIDRFLVSGKSSNRRALEELRTYVERLDSQRAVEVRHSSELHDRVLIADDGDVLTIGTSLNGIGKSTTVLTPIPPPASATLADDYETKWEAATELASSQAHIEPPGEDDTGD